MPKVPHIDQAILDPRKVTDYLLDLVHPVGKAKAHMLVSHGFDPLAPDVLAQALLDYGALDTAQALRPTPHGAKYVVRGVLHTPDGRGLKMRTVWIIDAGSTRPRFVTAVPD